MFDGAPRFTAARSALCDRGDAPAPAGGVAVHTTEFNVFSDTDTLRKGGTVLFRRRDIEEIARSLRRRGNRIELGLTGGDRPEDDFLDVPPYTHDPHLKIRVAEYVSTATGMIIEKSSATAREAPTRRHIWLGIAAGAALTATAYGVLRRRKG